MSALATHSPRTPPPTLPHVRSFLLARHSPLVTRHRFADFFRLHSYITHGGWGCAPKSARAGTALHDWSALRPPQSRLASAAANKVDSAPMKSHGRKPAQPEEQEKIVPIILAAGPRGSLRFPKALAPFGRDTALERAVRCCSEARGLGPPVVVLGSDAERILTAWKPPKGTIVIQNPEWREGQISSLRAGLRRVPRNAAFLIYPVDYPLLFPGLLARLWWAYTHRAPGEGIVVPAMNGRDGHPILVAPELRQEFVRAEKARDVVHREDRPERILRVRVRDSAIFRDFDSPSTYRLCLRILAGHHRA